MHGDEVAARAAAGAAIRARRREEGGHRGHLAAKGSALGTDRAGATAL